MFKNRLLETLKHPKNGNDSDDETVRAIAKIQEHKRLSSQEFQKIYDSIWQEGPKTEYKNPENWRKGADTTWQSAQLICSFEIRNKSDVSERGEKTADNGSAET